MSSSPRIDVDQVELRYSCSDTNALDGISLTLEGGKLYGLLGRNGSGKTSLLSVIAAFRRASAGEVRVAGQPVFENSLVAPQICLIRESGDTVEHDWPTDRVRDALSFAERTRPNWDAQYAAGLVERFELPAKARVNGLSRGERSKLGIVLGLASRAPVTMFDESHLGMDAPSRYAFYDELLKDFMAHPRTIVVSTHLIEEVGTLFEEVVIIDDGHLLLHEETEVLRSRGASVTGPADDVDRFAEGLSVLSEQHLGPTKRVMVYGDLDNLHRKEAERAGLDLGPVALQDLFVHLTEPVGGPR